MPDLPVVGHVPDPDPATLEPVRLPVAARKLDGSEVVDTFEFRPNLPPTVDLMIGRFAGAEMPLSITLACLNDLALNEKEKERWITFYQRADLLIDASIISAVLIALIEHYAGRPTRRSPGSSRTGRRTGKTLKAAASSAA